MFCVEEAKEAGFLDDLELEVKEEGELIGTIDAVSADPDGDIYVRYNQAKDAEACLYKMHGRFFNGKRILAHFFGEKRIDENVDFDLLKPDIPEEVSEELIEFMSSINEIKSNVELE